MTGAGISVASGLQTFRAGGLWENNRIEDVATPQAFARDPVLVWKFYNQRRRAGVAAQPNAGHLSLVKLERAVSSFVLVTQNVDGLHQAAGSSNVLELHGSLLRVRCTGCGKTFSTTEVLPDLPRCDCGQLLRPDIVWFGEDLCESVLRKAKWSVARGGVLPLVGTSAVVHPAAGLIQKARLAGVFIIEINPARTEATQLAHAVLRGDAAEMLPSLVNQWVG